MNAVIRAYQDYYKKMKRDALYKNVAEKYKVHKAIYPGSYIDITPSLYIQDVIYR